MNLAFVSYFLAVAETGHFTRAADRLNVTQPTLSAGIARLEETLGARLFERRRRVALSEAGNRFLPQARAMLDAWSAARAELRAAPATRRPLRVGLLQTLPERIVLALTTRLSATGRAIDLLEAPVAPLQARLRRGQIDAALTVLDSHGAARQTRALHRESYVVALPPGHALAGHSRAGIGDLAATPFILRLNCEADMEARRRFAARDVRPPVAARTSSDARAAALVAAGIGASLMPESLVATDGASVAIPELRLDRRLGLVIRSGIDGETSEMLRDAARALPWTPPRPGPLIAH
jgi:DNA-binding transcriptional LysR family regulator